MSKRITLFLSADQRSQLEQLTRSGNAPARVQTRARILLLADRSQNENRTVGEISSALGCSPTTVVTVRRQCIQEGLEAALYDKARPGRPPKITGDVEAKIIALTCSDPPEGHARWTLRLLADRVVELDYLPEISHAAIAKRLKKTNFRPGG